VGAWIRARGSARRVGTEIPVSGQRRIADRHDAIGVVVGECAMAWKGVHAVSLTVTWPSAPSSEKERGRRTGMAYSVIGRACPADVTAEE
jgi:hypothetical protein